jgi:GT2 family glycosyltransferase
LQDSKSEDAFYMAKVIAFKPRRLSSLDAHVEPRPRNRSVDNVRDLATHPDVKTSRAGNILISIVVPTCGRPALLSHCLASLLRQDFDRSRYEIVVVDDRPGSSTREVVQDWAAQVAATGPAVRYIASEGPHGPAAARNKGWRAALGAIIAFTDDDTVSRPQWLASGLQAFDADVHAVWGRIVMPLNRIPTDYEKDAKGLETAEFVTANCFCTRKALEKIKGFDERFRYAWREDADLYFRLLELDGRVLHAPTAVVVHPIRPAGWGVSIRQQKKVLFDALLYKKHPALYRQKIRPHARWDYYVIVAALIAFVAALALGAPSIATGAALVWLFLTARFCAKRLQPTIKTPAHVAEMIVTSAVIPVLSVFWRMVGALRFRVPFF